MAERAEPSQRQTAPPDALARAMGWHREGRLDEAEALYRELLAAQPRNADAMHFLGLLERQRGRSAEALELMSAAVEVAPDYASAHNNLGNLLCEAGRLDEAQRHLERVLELEPRDVRALNNLGSIARAAGRHDEARRLYERAIELSPGFPLPYENLGRLYIRTGEVHTAYLHFCKASALDPTLAFSRQFVGMALYELGRHEEARAHYEQWIEAEPDNPVPRHLLGTVSAAAEPARAADEYVRRIFDDFASTFDIQLERLEYRAPGLVTATLAAALGEPRDLDVLDAGCGTGLCGALLRPMARRLDGVDLSPGMLERARAGGNYDALTEAELTAYMAAHAGHYDAITCADTLCYFGALDSPAQAAFAALRPGGRFVLTLEALTDAGAKPFRLNASGRYSHREDDVRKILQQAGFDRIDITHATLRMEIGKEVDGLIVLARRPG